MKDTKESEMEAVVVLALLVALGALVAGDGTRPPAVRDIARPAGTGRRTPGRAGWRSSRSPESAQAGAATAAQGEASGRRPQGASDLPARPAPPYRVKVGCCPRCARLRHHGG
jgi:hypothetical protein